MGYSRFECGGEYNPSEITEFEYEGGLLVDSLKGFLPEDADGGCADHARRNLLVLARRVLVPPRCRIWYRKEYLKSGAAPCRLFHFIGS